MLAAAALFTSILTTSAFAEVKVVTSIRPIHSLVSAIMQGAGSPYLIIKQTGSPHTYSMKPSDARAIDSADLIFWVGDGLETFLKKPVQSLGKKARSIELMKTPGLTLLPLRESDGHHDDDHHHHDDGHDHDVHVWLSPENAKKLAEHIAATLSKADPTNKGVYQKNLVSMKDKLGALTKEVNALLKPKRDQAIIVFHDSYQYFEKAFQLSKVSAVTVNPEVPLSAKRILKLSREIKKKNVRCLFLEPQFQGGMVNQLARNFSLPTGVLDPLGSNVPSGPELYFEMMRKNAKAIATCG